MRTPNDSNTVSVRQTCALLTTLTDRALDGGATVITQAGTPVAALVSMDDYNALENAIDEYLAQKAEAVDASEAGQPRYSMSEVVADITTRQYADHMARTQTLVQLTDDMVDRLDAEAKRQGCSRSALVRCVLTEYLRERSEQAEVARYIQAYQEMPQADPQDPSSVTGAAVRAGIASMQRLDAEEEAAGLEW